MMRKETTRRGYWTGMALVAVMLAMAPPVYALINPNFTPRHLIEQSDAILQLNVKPSDKPQILVGQVVKVLKGKDRVEKGDVTIALDAMPEKDAKDVADSFAAQTNQPALLFTGSYTGSDTKNLKAALHIGGRWLTLDGSSRTYKAIGIDGDLEPTWAGATDQFILAIEQGLDDPQLDYPVKAGVVWECQKKVCKIEGKVYSAQPVSLSDRPGKLLHIGAERGDRLFEFDADAKSLKDVTGRFKLAARSAACVWGDFNHDGRLDLASWDGKALSLHLRAGDGTFLAKEVDLGAALKSGCVGLALLDCGRKGIPALLAATPDRPVLIVPKDDGSYAATPLAAADAFPKDLGVGAPCLVADLDGDQIGDVLQMFEKSSFFYKGRGSGNFDKPVQIMMGRGAGRGAPFLGDYDHDGRLDVFCPGDDRCRLWQNGGNLNFEDWLKKAGELTYISQPGAIGGMTADFNNDGRQDILILYKDMGPQLFFNRGFRSFGHAQNLAPTVQTMDVDDASQQAGCLGDFNGDGAQDLALVLKPGELMFFLRDASEGAPLAVNAGLALDGSYAGPVTVVGWKDKRCLGAWNVTAGSAEGFIATPEASPVKLRWQLPGAKPQEKEILLEDKPLPFVIKP